MADDKSRIFVLLFVAISQELKGTQRDFVGGLFKVGGSNPTSRDHSRKFTRSFPQHRGISHDAGAPCNPSEKFGLCA